MKWNINKGFEIKEENTLKEIKGEYNYFKIIERVYVDNSKTYYIKDYQGNVWRNSKTLDGLIKKIEEDREGTFA